MKAQKIIILSISLAIMASCETYYRITTKLDRKGGVVREIYAKGDSTFMSGDQSHNPFQFDLDGWNITRFDSIGEFDYFGEKKPFNVKVRKKSNSVDSLSHDISCKKDIRPLIVPKETLTKKFKWFYTDYIYTSIYKKLDYNSPIPIGKYLSEEERRIWAQGDTKYFGTMNGFMLNNMLCDISDKFIAWLSINFFEISFNSVNKIYGGGISGNNKEQIYIKFGGKNIENLSDPKSVCAALDSFYVTDRFSKLYKQNKDTLDNEFENATSVISLLDYHFTNELAVPGKVISTNAPIIDAGYLKWKVDGMRLLFDDYTLTASYRVVNIWAFVISGLILILAIILIIVSTSVQRKSLKG